MKNNLLLMSVISLLLVPTYTRAKVAELPIDNLSLYMSFDNIKGNKVEDLSGKGNHGEIKKAKQRKETANMGMPWNSTVRIATLKSSIRTPDRFPTRFRFRCGSPGKRLETVGWQS